MPTIPEHWQSIAILIATLSLLFYWLNGSLLSQPMLNKVSSVMLACCLGFAWNAHYAQTRLDQILSTAYEGKDLVIEGRVNALPQSNASGAKFSFAVDQVFLDQEEIYPFPKQIYLSWQPAWRNPQNIPEIIPGQRWRFKAKMKRPYGSLNPYTFDYERWSFHQDYGAIGSVRTGELIASREIAWTEFSLAMEYQRWQLRQRIDRLLPKDARYGGVIAALVMGDQNAIDQDDWRVFNATGIGHLISISGLHVTMLAGVGATLASWLWRRRSLPLYIPVSKVAASAGFLTAFVYAWLAGFQIPAQRTMYMVGVVAFAMWSGRDPRSFDIWWWALAMVLLIDPMAPYTPGFWLSFGAVAAILYAMKDSEGLLGIPTGQELALHWRHRFSQAIREACRVQAVVTIALLPLTLYWFYQFSIISPLANAFAIPVVSYLVTPLAISGALLPEFIGKWLLVLAHASMAYLAAILDWMAGFKWAIAFSSQPTWWALLISLVGIVMAIRPGNLSMSWASRLLGLGLCACLLVRPLGNTRLEAGEFQATVLDIGQGTAVLIETAHKTLLYDTGPIQGKDNAGQRIILPFLRGRGINTIDRMVISHSDSDHISGASTLLKEIRFNTMMGSLPINNPLLANLSQRKIPSIPCRFGQSWIWDDVEFYIWHPHEASIFAEKASGKPNEMSCVLEVRNSNTSFWLTGDVERQGEAEIINRLTETALHGLKGKNLIFMAPHHGSKTSSSLDLLKTLEPDIAFAQNGYRNRYGHPHPTVTQRYRALAIPFHQTPLTGAQIWTFRGDHGLPRSQAVYLWREQSKRLWHR
ncbi:MAG TPA: DNA internalization-related competence protein ComEC/Rec2 [Polynucleobacter sp.]|nr:DNA internalization-related competence protein ComEC/Rec2 [Polynucleobacter sp.]